ncbi:MAG: hypothetical protein WEC75_07645 [Dehalococcoidia bacterium]
MSRSGRSLAIALLVASVALLLLIPSAGAAHGEGRHRDAPPDLEVALRLDGRCGRFADSLPPLVIASGVRAGETVADVDICVRSRGNGEAGPLSLQATELVDVEVACTGDEGLVDASCGTAAAGELSQVLLQDLGVGSCRKNAALTPSWQLPLADLAESPIVLNPELNGRICVRLRLSYSPGVDGATAGQSDRSSWRYTFTLEAP